MSAALHDARRTPPLLGGLLVLIVVLLLISIGLQAGVVNPTTQGTQADVRELQCAQAEVWANSTRFRLKEPDGTLETREHFLTRMLAQRHVLQLARGNGCDSTPGFPPFGTQVARALRELDGILGYRPKAQRGAAQRQLQVHPNLSKDLDNGSDGEGAPASTGSAGAVAPAGSDDAPAPGHPGSHAPTVPQEGGSDPAPAPSSPSPTARQPPSTASNGGSTVTNPAQSATPAPVTATPTAPATDPGVVQSTIERVDGAVTPTVCAVSELLRGTCP